MDQLMMSLETLQTVQMPDIPQGYHIRNYQPGDEQAWIKLISESLEYSAEAVANDWQKLADDPTVDPQDIFFICCDGEIVGTGTAMRRPSDPPETGYVHMIGVDSTHRGKKLGQIISIAVMNRLVEKGYKHALLLTDDHRLSAISIYLKLGFVPVINSEEMHERWTKISKTLGTTIPGVN